MIKIREIINELTELPRPNRRRAEELIKFVYSKGIQDQKRFNSIKVKKYDDLFSNYKNLKKKNNDLELLLPPNKRFK